MSKHGDFIREIRKQKGISQRALALKCGISHAYIVKIERGQQRGSYFTLLKIADVLGIEPALVLEQAGFALVKEGKPPAYDAEYSEFSKLQPDIRKKLLEIARIMERKSD